ncbi:unnamed protein product [Moneuplotes crassus]|uniref:SET domain-containing protein n=1 Tax=Euplotes crassus TaxID=5936 RepID=A0AAD1YA51_EUPCR|nr:unnamed protein product [Moneuplotes crassus]
MNILRFLFLSCIVFLALAKKTKLHKEVKHRQRMYNQLEQFVVDGAIQVRYEEQKGFFTVAKKEIDGVTVRAPAEMTLSVFEEFELKKVFEEFVAKEKRVFGVTEEGDYLSTSVMLAFRIHTEKYYQKAQEMISKKSNPDLYKKFLYSFPWSTNDLSNWSDKDFEYYQKVAFSAPEFKDNFSRNVYSLFMGYLHECRRVPGFSNCDKLIELFQEEKKVVNTIDVVLTRSIGIYFKDWQILHNNFVSKSRYNVSSFLMPLADVPNHRFTHLDPENPNFTEQGKFHLTPEKGYVGFKVDKTFNEGLEGNCDIEDCEEYNFIYIPMASNAYMVSSYGIADIDNKFIHLNPPLYLKSDDLSPLHQRLCKRFLSSNDCSLESLSLASWEEESSNDLLTFSQIRSLKLSNSKGRRSKQTQEAKYKELEQTYLEYGYFDFYSEISSIQEVISTMENYLDTKTDITWDLKEREKYLEKSKQSNKAARKVQPRLTALAASINEKRFLIKEIESLYARMEFLIDEQLDEDLFEVF